MSETTQTAPDATGENDGISGASILLDKVTKRYGGQTEPAVNGLTLEIPAGKIVMLVGPSGCGKTTTLKMINRLIEPSEGRIVLGDDDVTDIDGDKLRRRIGYVIQAGGLFPHMTVENNIAMVPKMLGWGKGRISERVDELLELVSLDAAQYRSRYPKELSGGQQQRIGVARALAADPPVLLMDEPFGAVDPITRQRLQDELLHIQEEVQKTIVCVTHDFDEAVKLGDWIAIFSQGAQLVQYDTPERILADPANEFVEDFIGSGAGLKQLTLTRVGDVGLADAVLAHPGDDASVVLARLDEAGDNHAVIVDKRQRPIQWLSRRQLGRIQTIDSAKDEHLSLVGDRATLNDALDTMLVSSAGAALVTGRHDAFKGVIDVQAVMDAITRAHEVASKEHVGGAPVGVNTGSTDEVAETQTPATAGKHAGDDDGRDGDEDGRPGVDDRPGDEGGRP